LVVQLDNSATSTVELALVHVLSNTSVAFSVQVGRRDETEKSGRTFQTMNVPRPSSWPDSFNATITLCCENKGEVARNWLDVQVYRYDWGEGKR
jgi:hypothetical protein